MATDNDTNIEFLKEKVKVFVQERDWEQFHHPKELAISLNLEAAELLELFQWKEKEDIGELKKNKELIQKIREELADIIVYSLNLANQTGIDVTDAVVKKLEENAKKYPIEKSKGSNKKYTELQE